MDLHLFCQHKTQWTTLPNLNKLLSLFGSSRVNLCLKPLLYQWFQAFSLFLPDVICISLMRCLLWKTNTWSIRMHPRITRSPQSSCTSSMAWLVRLRRISRMPRYLDARRFSVTLIPFRNLNPYVSKPYYLIADTSNHKSKPTRAPKHTAKNKGKNLLVIEIRKGICYHTHEP